MSDMKHATVTATEPLAPGIVQVTLAFEKKFHFLPGQYLTLQFDDGVTRAYCIASAPQRPQAVQICVRLGKGPGSENLRELKVGERVSVDGPAGSFSIPAGDRRDMIFLAGDVGIAPVRSIVLHLKAVEDPRPITVLYEPAEGQILYAGDFKRLGASGAIRYHTGTLEELLPGVGDALDRSLILAAGYDPFLLRVYRAMKERGVPATNIHSESFGSL